MMDLQVAALVSVLGLFHPGLLHDLLYLAEWGVFVFFIVANTFYAMLLVLAVLEIRSHRMVTRDEDLDHLLSTITTPRVSVLAPAFNEAATIAESVRSLLSLYYPQLEILVVNDGSTDDTLTVLQETFDLQQVALVYDEHVPTKPVGATYRSRSNPGLIVVDKENGGKADSLNVALNLASGDLVCAIDADTLIEPDALQRMVRPFRRDPDILAAGGTIRIANACTVRDGRVDQARVPRSPLPGFQVIEYLRAFLFGRVGMNRLGGNLVISGAFGLFRREAVAEAGGYDKDQVGEDMELVVRLRKRALDADRPSQVVFIPDPVAWTEVPSSLRTLGPQRDRWHRGLAQALHGNPGILLRPRYGRMGLVVYPYFLFVELLAPLIEAFGLAALVFGLAAGALDLSFAWLFLLFAYGYGLLLTLITVVLDELTYRRYRRFSDKVWLVVWALAENMGYRQLTVWWRLKGLVRFLRGHRDWGHMERRGFDVEKTTQDRG